MDTLFVTLVKRLKAADEDSGFHGTCEFYVYLGFMQLFAQDFAVPHELLVPPQHTSVSSLDLPDHPF